MKKPRRLAWKLLAAVAGLVVLNLGCQTIETPEQSLPSTVLRVKGVVDYSEDEGAHWRTMKAGKVFMPGVRIRTAKASRAHIALGIKIRPPPRSSLMDYRPELLAVTNGIVLLEDSTVALEELSSRRQENATDPVPEIRINLQTGGVFVVSQAMIGDSYYHINFPKGVVQVREGWCMVDARGDVAVLRGTVTLVLTNTGNRLEIPRGFRFDVGTGELAKLPDMGHVHPLLGPFRSYLDSGPPPALKEPARRRFF